MAAQVLLFWFDDPALPGNEYGQQRQIWFRKNSAFDQQVRERFLPVYERARQHAYDFWLNAPKTALALVLLLDQFPRNMFRGTPRSFEADEQALQVAQTAVTRGYDCTLKPMERMFLYLPFEHSENIDHQDRAVALFEALVTAAPELQSALEYAYRHREVIDRFGRFPHRNPILQRPSTSAEQEFLEKPGSRF